MKTSVPKNAMKTIIKNVIRTLALVALPLCLGYLLYSTYSEVRAKTIKEFNTLQMVMARQAAERIRDLFDHLENDLSALAMAKSIVNPDDRGKALIRGYYQHNADNLRCIFLVDASGKILLTEPYDKAVIGQDISGQDDIKEVQSTHKIVVSEVFDAVQGYKAVAFHVPLFKNGVFHGTLAALIPFDNLANRYLGNIRIGENGYAWVISKTGVELYCPVPGHLGRSIFETSKKSPSVISMARKMLKGKSGFSQYTYDWIRDKEKKTFTKHAAFYPVELGNTFWSVAVATPEEDVLAAMTGFRNKIISIGLLFILVGLSYVFYFLRTRAVLASEKIRREAGIALRQSEARLRQVMDLVPHFIFSVDKAGRFILANKTTADFYGTKVEELVGKTYGGFHVREEEVLRAMAENQSVIENGRALIIGGKIITRADGKRIFVQGIKIPFNLPYAQDEVILTVYTDITDLKEAEEALAGSEKKYRDLVENANSIILIWDDQGNIRFMNRYALDFFGYTEEEIIGKNVVGTIVPESESTTERDLASLMEDIRKDPDQYRNNENENIKKSGDRVWVSWTNRAILDNSGIIVEILSIGNDITEIKNLEIQLRRAQRMESVGTLAGGIAHDFNNLLMGIQGRISLMMIDCDPADPRFEHMQGIGECVRKAAGLTRQLLGFARGGKYEVKPTDLNELVRKNTDMFGRTQKEITIKFVYKLDLWPVEVDRGQIEQVLMNLLVNGSQSMPGGGEMLMKTDNVILDEAFTGAHGVPSGKYVMVSLTDTGEGMDPEVRERIFEPFFTTKDKGRGTGLGLASAYGIVKNHRGIIDVISEKGKGSTFTVYLPATDKDVAVEKDQPGILLKGVETILLVDDEEMTRDVGQQMLRKLGYNVIVAGGGKEALEMVQKEAGRIALVILDMIMPDMDGGEVFDRLKIFDPSIKVLLSSGYSIDGKAAAILKRGCNGFIQKPFSMDDFSIKLREILDQ
jgi:two-component system, cell cycle sensor histidine kinase and response regulator CckA